MKKTSSHESNFFSRYFEVIADATQTVSARELESVATLIIETYEKKGKVILVGNGGSAAMSSHLSVDLTKAAGIRAINFNEADLLTCFANDYGYENWVAKALEAYADPQDMVILISSSGESRNILNGAVQAKKMAIPIISFSGFSENNALRQLGQVNFWCDSRNYNIVEMTHHIWLLGIVDFIIDKKPLIV